MPGPKQRLPIHRTLTIKSIKLIRIVIILLQHFRYEKFEIKKILAKTLLTSFIGENLKIHELDLAIESNADVLLDEVSVRDFHVVEEGVGF